MKIYVKQLLGIMNIQIIYFKNKVKIIIEQIDNYLYTTRRYNANNIFINGYVSFKCSINKNFGNLPILSLLDLQYNLIKYNNKANVKQKFPHF